jgi:hypothetical protein
LRAARPVWIRKSSEVDLVHGVVEVREVVAGEEVGGQRVEDVAGGVEGAVDQGAQPTCLDALVRRVDGHEPAGVGALVCPAVLLDDLDALGDELDTVAALDLPGDHDARLGLQAPRHPRAAPDGDRQVARTVVELGREAGGPSPNGPADGLHAHHAPDDRRLLPDAEVADPLHVREVLVAGWVVRDHVGHARDPEVL